MRLPELSPTDFVESDPFKDILITRNNVSCWRSPCKGRLMFSYTPQEELSLRELLNKVISHFSANHR